MMVMMKFRAVYLLLLSIVSWCRGEEQITGVTGSNVTFRASVNVRPSEINWLKNEIKIVDLEEGKEPDFYRFYNIKERVIVNLAEKTFTLLDVIPGDSGRYKAMLLVDGTYQNLFFSLRVLDPVCNVSVQNTTVGNNVTLRCFCSSDGAEPVQYEWRNVSHRLSVQQNLTVSMGEKPQTLWCIASNQVSSSNATITVPPRTPESTGAYRSHIIIAVTAITITIIVLITALCYYKKSPCGAPSVSAGRHRKKELQIGEDHPPTRSVDGKGSCGGTYILRSDTELLPCLGGERTDVAPL
ncbi:lymphocyte function-associated antigen 3-like isoform X4 [Phyllobates terribilis]|uniref:lymphocyte function-associated antigen 3-like isoform X4 n=1 Tax=Phyllobates terribilis TaxID=111132 RepID=UPI003CCAFD82